MTHAHSCGIRAARLLALCAPALSLGAHAQTPVDAGQLLQQMEKARSPALPAKIAPATGVPPPPMKAAPGATVMVTAFQFSGNTLLDAARLAPLVASYTGRALSFAELEQAAAAVAEAYRLAGWIVRVYLPQQDIRGGVVTIEVIEAVFGGARVEGDAPHRVAAARVLAMIDAAQPRGVALNAERLDRALLLADDLPGVTVAGSLREGDNARETALLLRLADEPWGSGEAGLDNSGARSTGSGHATANLYLNSPLGLADLASVNLIHAQGSDYARLAYTLPLGMDGWRVGASGSALRYRLVASDFASLRAKGDSVSTGLEATYPLLRSRAKNLVLGVNLDRHQFDNQANLATTSNYDIDSVSINLNGNLFDDLGGGGANGASLALLAGRVKLGAPDSGENTALEGGYRKLRYTLSRQQAISDSWSLYAALSGQKSGSAHLDSSEKFYLGGAGGVRAYPGSEGGGSGGSLASVELRWRGPGALALTAFYDQGAVRSDDGSKNYSLKGGGLAASWQTASGASIKASLARRRGDNPNPAANGNDQDGSLNRNRLWLSASLPF